MNLGCEGDGPSDAEEVVQFRRFLAGEMAPDEAKAYAAGDVWCTQELEMRNRMAAQEERTDRTPMTPRDEWCVESTWEPLHDTETGDVVTTPHENEEAARRSALSLSCCAGARVIRVAAPDGSIRYAWDREGNFFQTL